MLGFGKTLRMVMVLALVTSVAACQNSDEQAEEHFRNAMALLEEGDTVRASIEFRNVFQNNGQHREARQAYADMLRETGETQQSYGQYLRLVEQYPEDVDARIALAEMALDFQNWEEVRWHGQRAVDLAPDAPQTAVIALNLDYLAAIEAEDAAARREVSNAARAGLETDPGNALLLRLVIDSLVRDREFAPALDIIDGALAADPGARGLHNTRLQIMATLDRPDQVEAQLQEMLRLFPEDSELQAVLLRFYIARDEIAAAQELLIELAGSADTQIRREEALAALVRLRLDREGPEAALLELDRIIATEVDNPAPFRALRAGLLFEGGDRTGGIAEIEALLDGDLSQIQRGRFQTVLAQMQLQDGNIVGAQRLVDAVLEADPNQTEALKLRSAWLIERDETDRAIQHLRTVLDDSPEDPAALTLMASAYARAGNRELAREFLSLAMQASGFAPAETIRYASTLVEEDRYLLAEETLIAALRLTPNHPDLLTNLGQVYLQMSDWSRAEGVERALHALETEATTAVADRLRVAILAGRGQITQALDMLEAAAAAADGDVGAQAAVIQARLSSGDIDGALSFADALVARTPDNAAFRHLLAMVHVAAGQVAEAEVEFRAATETDPQMLQAWLGLIRAQTAQDRPDSARVTLDAALAVLPEAPDLLWADASLREQSGDIEGAIAIYERLYEVASGSLVVANNLASLISTYRDDAESLARAYEVARRLRGSDVAPFQDTYGWIAYRRGEIDDALEHLEPAAAVLSEDPLVQYHLGMVYLSLGRTEAALEQLQHAVEIAGPEDTRAQFLSARTEIAALQAATFETEISGVETAPAQ